MDHAVTIEGLSHSYMVGTPLSRNALRDVALDIDAGEFVAVVGSTGSGKSTLLQHMNGIYRPQTGRVVVLGHDLSDPASNLTALRRDAGLVLQNPGRQLFERFAGDDVAFGPRMAGLTGPELTKEVRWAMEKVGLDFARYRDRPTMSLSGGERRKVGLAGVIALRPRILLLDEPAAGLDPAAHAELLGTLGDLHREGVTIVMATHNMDDVAALCERVVVLSAGHVVSDGPVRKFFADAGSVRALGLELPSATALAHVLADHGIPIRTDVLTIREAADGLRECIGAGR